MFKKDSAKWWRITKCSRRVVKYIFVYHEALLWLDSTVKDCVGSVGSYEFLRTRRKGNRVLLVQRGKISMAVSFPYWSLAMRRREA